MFLHLQLKDGTLKAEVGVNRLPLCNWFDGAIDYGRQ
ncbi:MAG: hypothetical protein CM15mV116_050 [uncultured marine virus]|nr:MAG: hypothetical protein CM15mV116_050 [uncultured marine virus]